jgi:hypothetical protein
MEIMSKQQVIFVILVILFVGSLSYWAGVQKTSRQGTNAHPENLSAQFPTIYSEGYYHSQDWKLTAESKPFSCVEKDGTPGEEKVNKRIINGNTYCVYSASSGAAGTTYTDYKYVSEQYGALVTISFSLGEVNCSNYDEPRQSTCSNEEMKLNGTLDSTVDTVFANIKNSN